MKLAHKLFRSSNFKSDCERSEIIDPLSIRFTVESDEEVKKRKGKKIRFRYNSVEERNIQSLYTSSQRLQLRSGIKGGTSPDRKFVQPVSAFKLRETIVFSYDQRTRSGLPLLAPFVPFSSVSGNVSSPSRSRLPSWRSRSDNSMNVDLGEIPVEITSCWVEKKLKRKRIYIYN